MSASLFIVLEREIEGVDASSVSGKFLSRQLEWLDEAAAKLHVRRLGELISFAPDEVQAFLDSEGGDAEGFDVPPEQWFDAADGLRTIEALVKHAESLTTTEKGLLLDLRACKQVLERARESSVKFHFAVDY